MRREQKPIVTLSGLRKRGWTPALVRRFLGEPDARKQNPHRRSAAPTQVHALARVEAIETTDERRAAWGRAEGWVGPRVAAVRREKTRRAAQSTPVTVTSHGRGALLSVAIEHFNSHCRYDDIPATTDSDPAFLERIQVNYLRHIETDSCFLDGLWGRVGVHEGKRIRHRFPVAIAAARIGEAGEHHAG